MSKIVFLNGVKYHFVASTRDFRDKEPKSIIEAMTPLVKEMDANYLKFRQIMDGAFKKEKRDR